MIRDICKELNSECLLISSCNKICDKIKASITFKVNSINRIKTYPRQQTKLNQMFKYKQCPLCQSQDISANCVVQGERYIDRDYILCSFCNTLFSIGYNNFDIQLEEIKNFSEPLQSSKPSTFTIFIDTLKTMGLYLNEYM